MLKRFLIYSIFGFFLIPLQAQSRFPGVYFIEFIDKANSIYSTQHPEDFLSEKSLQRREKFSISVNEQDLPVNQNYTDSLIGMGLKLRFCSKWMNAAVVEINDTTTWQLLETKNYVKNQRYLSPIALPTKEITNSKLANENVEDLKSSDESPFGFALHQFEMLGVPAMQGLGFKGQGVTIALFDGGFSNANTLKIFDSLFTQNHVKATYNIADPFASVYDGSDHGTMVLSCIAANVPKTYCGTAPNADFYLFKTENDKNEYPIEEANWLKAAEIADSIGVDLITSSLGYYDFDDQSLNYSHSQLDGKTALVSIAAQIAAEKGIMVVNSAGNSGTNSWGKISFPSDAKDVVCVGAIDQNGVYANFSSRGYSADGRVKPEIVAVGKGIILYNNQGKLIKANGTSFSAPSIAGCLAILMQANPNKSPNEIRTAFYKSANYSKPDSMIGYGLPNVFFANTILHNNAIKNPFLDNIFSISPNPFSDKIAIYFFCETTQKGIIEILDLTGKTQKKIEIANLKKGYNFIEIKELGAMENAVYVIRLQIGDMYYSRKMFKCK